MYLENSSSDNLSLFSDNQLGNYERKRIKSKKSFFKCPLYKLKKKNNLQRTSQLKHLEQFLPLLIDLLMVDKEHLWLIISALYQ